jgi:hypothetical protein
MAKVERCPSCQQVRVKRPVCPECKNQIVSGKHPAWNFASLVVIVGAAFALLYGTAQNFDDNEIKILTGIAGVATPVLLGPRVISMFRG